MNIDSKTIEYRRRFNAEDYNLTDQKSSLIALNYNEEGRGVMFLFAGCQITQKS